MDFNTFVSKTAHRIDPTDPAHTWEAVADVTQLKSGHRFLIYQCKGCPQTRWENQ